MIQFNQLKREMDFACKISALVDYILHLFDQRPHGYEENNSLEYRVRCQGRLWSLQIKFWEIL